MPLRADQLAAAAIAAVADIVNPLRWVEASHGNQAWTGRTRERAGEPLETYGTIRNNQARSTVTPKLDRRCDTGHA